MNELNLKGKCLYALAQRDNGSAQYGMLVMMIAQRLGVNPEAVDREITRIAMSD